MGFSCTIYKIPLNFSLSLNKKPGTGNPNIWCRKFRSFRYKREKGITFFAENFHRDQPFHLNSPWNFRVFHTNGKRSQTWLVYHNYGMFHFLSTPPPSPPLPKDDWHPHPRIFVGTLWKIKSKEFIFCQLRWYLCPQGMGHLSTIFGVGAGGGGEELTSPFSHWSFYYTFLFACLLCWGMF